MKKCKVCLFNVEILVFLIKKIFNMYLIEDFYYMKSKD